MNIETIAECLRLSFADTPFPVVVGKLAGAGVAAYTADLTALRKTYYDAGAGSHDEAMPLADPPAIAAAFDAAAVAASVRAIQQKQIGYAEFLRQIVRAGCTAPASSSAAGKPCTSATSGRLLRRARPGGP